MEAPAALADNSIVASPTGDDNQLVEVFSPREEGALLEDSAADNASEELGDVSAQMPKAAAVVKPTSMTGSHHGGYPQHEGAFSISYKAYLRAMSCAIVNMLPFPWRARQPRCVLLGRRYDFSDLDDHEAFKSDFTSRILFTYRHGFAPLTPSSPHIQDKLTGNAFANSSDPFGTSSAISSDHQSAVSMNKKISSFFRHRISSKTEGLTTDSGWGCMIRVFQMAIAQVLMQLHFGRDWRRPEYGQTICVSRKQVLLRRCQTRSRRCFSLDLSSNPLNQQPTHDEIISLLNHDDSIPASIHSSIAPFSNSKESLEQAKEESEALHAHEQIAHEPMVIYPWNLLPILTLFRDDAAARFSLHRVVAVGRIGLGIKAGAWFGPTSCSDSMAVLIAGSSHLPDLPGNTRSNQRPLVIYPFHMLNGIRVSVYHSKHGEISRNRVQRLFRHSLSPVGSTAPFADTELSANLADKSKKAFPRKACDRGRSVSLPPHLSRAYHSARVVSRRFRSLPKITDAVPFTTASIHPKSSNSQTANSDAVVIFLSFRLGLDSFNMRYQPFLQSCFGMPQFQGLAGGGPLTSAYWFVAANDEHLYFLDPHSPVQPALRDVGQCVSICGCSASKQPIATRQAEINSAFSSPEAPGRPSWLRQSLTPLASEVTESCLRDPNVDGWTVLPGLRVNNQPCSKENVDQMFFPSAPKQLNWRALNPSMTLVFLCQSFLAFEDLLLRFSEVDSEGLISVVDEQGFATGGEFSLHSSGVSPESRKLTFDSAEDGFYLL
eukprot:Gregarina_sp_Poly_1__9457@NODE_593_length_7311_cov_152_329238_g458_i0_p1_GENE_NODE_593_length_7311_cov_152_329238_g458_i0NODE_593_length_7311_cov_152_329238_g458_i0_p1_ORF_typecomplete_len774_score75_66Peptidase_C54/PF03416_19/1e64_NODE_593_length_7311_cov_152_329238_g458_i030495370